MDNIKRNIILVGVVLFILGIVVAVLIPGFIHQRVDQVETPLEIKLKRENDSLAAANVMLNQKDSALVVINDSLSKGVAENKVKVIYLNNNKNEKIRIVDNYNGNQLYNFLSGVKAEGIN